MRCLNHLMGYVLLGSLILMPDPTMGGQNKPNEYQVKAAFLYNFGQFVQWPGDAESAQSDSFDICVIGQDPFGPLLDAALSGGAVAGKPTRPKRIQKPQDALKCRVLFIGLTERARLKAILDAVDKASVLTVSDIPQFTDKGGMIQFVMVDSRIRFEVNLPATEQAHLTISSELLKVAASVKRNPFL